MRAYTFSIYRGFFMEEFSSGYKFMVFLFLKTPLKKYL